MAYLDFDIQVWLIIVSTYYSIYMLESRQAPHNQDANTVKDRKELFFFPEDPCTVVKQFIQAIEEIFSHLALHDVVRCDIIHW